MYRLAIVLFTVAIGSAVQAFVAPNCGPNAEWQTCGSACVPNCANPEPPQMCTLQCVMGCFCKPGFLKNAKGECVLPEQCHEQTQSLMDAVVMPQCPDNEVFKPCGSACAPTCANQKPSPVCTRQCVIGCFCKPGYLRNKYHVCVPAENCEAPATEHHNLEMFAYPPGYTPMPVEAQVCADENEEFRQCKGCDASCDKPNPICPRICKPGCACKQGHVRNANGKCILKQQCPQNDLGLVNLMMMPPMCKANEVFHTCGSACAPTCANPSNDQICTRQCVIGCFCKEGYLKNAQGECVPAANC